MLSHSAGQCPVTPHRPFHASSGTATVGSRAFPGRAEDWDLSGFATPSIACSRRCCAGSVAQCRIGSTSACPLQLSASSATRALRLLSCHARIGHHKHGMTSATATATILDSLAASGSRPVRQPFRPSARCQRSSPSSRRIPFTARALRQKIRPAPPPTRLWRKVPCTCGQGQLCN